MIESPLSVFHRPSRELIKCFEEEIVLLAQQKVEQVRIKAEQRKQEYMASIGPYWLTCKMLSEHANPTVCLSQQGQVLYISQKGLKNNGVRAWGRSLPSS